MTRLSTDFTVSDHERLSREQIRKMKESGEWERLQRHLMGKLFEKDTSWRDHLIEQAKDTVRKNGGVIQVTVDQLVADLVPVGIATVPAHVQYDMMEHIRKSLQEQQEQSEQFKK